MVNQLSSLCIFVMEFIQSDLLLLELFPSWFHSAFSSFLPSYNRTWWIFSCWIFSIVLSLFSSSIFLILFYFLHLLIALFSYPCIPLDFSILYYFSFIYSPWFLLLWKNYQNCETIKPEDSRWDTEAAHTCQDVPAYVLAVPGWPCLEIPSFAASSS